jgi:hypothetical protein
MHCSLLEHHQERRKEEEEKELRSFTEFYKSLRVLCENVVVLFIRCIPLSIEFAILRSGAYRRVQLRAYSLYIVLLWRDKMYVPSQCTIIRTVG